MSGIDFRIGVDGGGSGTRAWLTDAAGRALGRGSAAASALRLGADAAWAQVRAAVDAAFADAGLPPAEAARCAVGLGLAGAGVAAQAQAFRAAAPPYARLVLDTDVHAAVLGAHGGGPGMVVVAGTGSAAAALARDGTRRLAGGWGFPAGDEGGGAWIGLQALRHAQQAQDGRSRPGPLADAVMAVAGRDRAALLAWCAQAGASEYATLAPVVFAQADADPLAQALLDDAALALAALARAADADGTLPLAVTGSVGRRLATRLPAPWRRRCVEPAGDAAQGAWRMVEAAA